MQSGYMFSRRLVPVHSRVWSNQEVAVWIEGLGVLVLDDPSQWEWIWEDVL